MAHQAIQLGEVRQMPATAIGQRLASAHLIKTGDCMLGQFGTAMNMGLPLGCSQPRQPRWAHCETVLLVVFFSFFGAVSPTWVSASCPRSPFFFAGGPPWGYQGQRDKPAGELGA